MKGTKTEVRPGVWRLRVFVGRRPNGSPIQVTKTVDVGDGKPGSGSRMADRELAKMVAAAHAGNLSGGVDTVDSMLDSWLRHCESIGRSPTTVAKYRQIADAVVRPQLGKIRLTKLTAGDLNRLYAKLTAKGNKATTVRRVHALIGAMLHHAELEDLVDRNVARRARPPVVRAAHVQAPTPEEVQAILSAAEKIEPMLATLLSLAALTGARRGELCGLRWTDINFASRTLSIERSVYEVEGGGWAVKSTKTHQGRKIGLDSLGLEVLRRHRVSVEHLADELDLEVLPEAFLFSRSPVGSEPVLPNVVTKFTTKMAKQVGVSTHLHAFRHFSATQAIAAGFDPVTVAGRLGHRDSSITLRVYSHALEARDRDLADALGRVLSPELTG